MGRGDVPPGRFTPLRPGSRALKSARGPLARQASFVQPGARVAAVPGRAEKAATARLAPRPAAGRRYALREYFARQAVLIAAAQAHAQQAASARPAPRTAVGQGHARPDRITLAQAQRPQRRAMGRLARQVSSARPAARPARERANARKAHSTPSLAQSPFWSARGYRAPQAPFQPPTPTDLQHARSNRLPCAAPAQDSCRRAPRKRTMLSAKSVRWDGSPAPLTQARASYTSALSQVPSQVPLLASWSS